MRVLHVNSGNLYGGIEKILATIAENRSACPEMISEFALSYQGRLSTELTGLGAAVHDIGAVRASRPWTVTAARARLRELLTRDYDVVIAHSAWPHGLAAPVVRETEIPLVFWMHSASDGRHWTSRWAARTPPDLVLCGSHGVAETAGNLFPRARTVVFYAPMPTPIQALTAEERAAVQRSLDTPPGATVIIQVGRMDPLKGQQLHLEALGTLRSVPGWVCWLVGGAQRPSEVKYFNEMKATAARLGITDRVRFLGERSDVPRLLASADVFCQPNQWSEGLSIAWMEAFQASLPIVTMDLGTAPEFIGETGGILVPPMDVGALATALRLLVEEREVRLKLGRNGHARVWELCDPQRQVTRLHDLLASVRRTAAAVR